MENVSFTEPCNYRDAKNSPPFHFFKAVLSFVVEKHLTRCRHYFLAKLATPSVLPLLIEGNDYDGMEHIKG